jgi:hypothetical protein
VKTSNKNSGTLCGNSQTCNGNTLTYSTTCNGSGTCVAGGSTTCSYGCIGTVCQTLVPNGGSCSASTDYQSGACSQAGTCVVSCGSAANETCCIGGICGSGYYCLSTTCQTLVQTGSPCSASSQCQSGHCDYTGTCVTSCGNLNESCCVGNTCNDPTTLNCNFSAYYCYNYHGA